MSPGRMAHGAGIVRARFRALERGDRLRLYAWLTLVGALAIAGLGVGDRLHRTEPVVSGTAAAKAAAINERAFGPSQGVVILLEGPPSVLTAEGPLIARRLDAVPQVQVLDPWRSRMPSLQPKPTQAELILTVHQPFEAASNRTTPHLRELLDDTVKPPLTSHLSGYPDIANAIHKTTVHAITRSEIIAAPILLIVVILVLGSPIAASMPLFLGGCVVAAGYGALDLVNRMTELDAGALNLATMLGLALGVDYSLLLVSRFRDELADGLDVTEASQRAAARAGRTVTFAAVVLALAMVGALLVFPGHILRSAAVGALVAVTLSATGAKLALPPLLRLAGRDVNRAQIVSPGAQSKRWSGLALRALRRPVVAGGVVLALLVAVSAPVLALETGPPNPLSLPKDSEARQDYDAIDREIGNAGARTAPFTITLVTRSGPLTDLRLANIARFRQVLERDPHTLAALGPTANADRDAAQFIVVNDHPNLTRTDTGYRKHLERLTTGLGRRTDSQAVVGGPAASLEDFDDAAKGNLPLLIGVLVAITYVALIPILRSLILPAIAVVLNVLTVLAAFGVLAFAFGPDHPLGGPGFVDDIMVDVVFSVVLALSIDYEIFLLDRMREGWDRTGTVDGAIEYGLAHTAGVITGAAAIMIGVFVAFAISPLVTIRELGVGLTVAVALDATLVRLVLLPAALRLAGPRAWRLPAGLAWLAPPPRAPVPGRQEI
ncbi:MAG TPA: MMPL family transporter [Thermoleophilaceae bacterium]